MMLYTMQTITIVNSHYISEGLYMCSNNSMYIICTRMKPAILVVTNLIVVLQLGNKGGEGEGEMG